MKYGLLLILVLVTLALGCNKMEKTYEKEIANKNKLLAQVWKLDSLIYSNYNWKEPGDTMIEDWREIGKVRFTLTTQSGGQFISFTKWDWYAYNKNNKGAYKITIFGYDSTELDKTLDLSTTLEIIKLNEKEMILKGYVPNPVVKFSNLYTRYYHRIQ